MEATLIILLLAAALTLLFPQGWPIAGALCVLAGLFVSIRLWRWRLWQYRLRPDLICLGIGYGWLALGLVAYGITIIYNAWQTTALHIITIGALGTLSAGVMARLHAQHVYRQSPPAHIVISATMLISAATLARLAATINPEITIPLLWTAASAWSLTYLLLAAYLSSRPATRAG